MIKATLQMDVGSSIRPQEIVLTGDDRSASITAGPCLMIRFTDTEQIHNLQSRLGSCIVEAERDMQDCGWNKRVTNASS